MRKCTNCGKLYEGNEKFCDECGSATEELKRFCENCGTEMPYDALFCNSCGTKVSEPIKVGDASLNGFSFANAVGIIKENAVKVFGIVTVFITNSFSSIQKNARKHNIPKFVVPTVAIVLCVAILFLIGFAVINAVRPNDKVYYFSGVDIYEYDLKKGEEKTIEEGNFSDYRENWNVGFLSYFTKMSENGDRIFYPHNYNDSDGGVNLYVRFVNKKDMSPIKVDSDVSSYLINSDGSKVLYYKGTNSAYYIKEIKKGEAGERQKIATDVYEFHYDDTFTSFTWKSNDGIWYSKKGDNDKVKIAGEDAEDGFVADNLDFYYLQEDTLFCRPFNKEKNKIDTDVIQFLADESGNVYYVKKGATQHYSYDYIYDDLYISDAAMTKPVEPDEDNYDSWGDYWDAYYEYRDANYAYNDKVRRDELREYLKEEKDDNQWGKELYFYNGKSLKKIADNIFSIAYADNDNKNIVYNVCNYENAKFYFSEYWKDLNYQASKDSDNEEFTASYVFDFSSFTENNVHSYYSYHNGTPVEFDAHYGGDSILFGNDGKMYYLMNTGSEYGSDLMVLNVKKNESTSKVYASDVATFTMLDDNRIMYKTEKNDDTGLSTLSIDDKVIDNDVSSVFMVDGDIFYYTDWNDKHETGTLKKYQSNGKSIVIADDVNSFVKLGKKFVILADNSSYKGDLYYYKSKSNKKLIAEDVSGLFNGYSGNSYSSLL